MKQDRLIGSTHYIVTKTYDAASLVSIAYPDGDTVGPMQYDGAGRVSSVSGILTSVSYDALGRPLTQSNGNGTTTNWTYGDTRGFLTRIQTTGGGGTIQDLQYTQYTDAGLLQQVTSPIAGEGWSYAYDDLNHLTTATNLTNGADTQTYSYDAGDRLLNSSRYGIYVYPGTGSARPHGPTSVGGTAISYDLNGNTLTAGTRGLTWNADNRLSQTTLGGVTATYSYGGDGDRVKKTSSLGTSIYPFGDDYEITGGVTTKYIPVGGLGVVAKRVGTGGSAVTYWLHTDRLGSIQAVTNTAGTAVFRRQYRPYGETLAQTGSHTESRGWIDQRNDGENGLTYLHARYFDPQLGVFVSPDPISVMGGLNQYSYAQGNPLNASDRRGLDAEQLCFTYTPAATGGTTDPNFGSPQPEIRCVTVVTVTARAPVVEPWIPTIVPQIAAPEGVPSGHDYRAGGAGASGRDDLGGDSAATRNAGFLLDVLLGTGRTERKYKPNDPQTEDMKESPGADFMRDRFLQNGCQSVSALSYSTEQAAWETVLRADLTSTAFQVGGFEGSVVNNNNGTATYTIMNDAGRNSLLLHIPSNIDAGSSGAPTPLRTIHQEFRWVEPTFAAGCR